jgi:hypothetical protein
LLNHRPQNYTKFKFITVQKKITIATSPYDVPWMSVLPEQTATVKVIKKGLDKKAKKDPTFMVKFKPSRDSIKINGLDSIMCNYTELNAMDSMTIKSIRILDSTRAAAGEYWTIDVTLENTGELIGQLNLSCTPPKKKHVIFVYVDIGTGYQNKDTGTYSKQNILNRINKYGHNQIFKEWHLDTKHNYLDTLDCRAAYLADSSKFLNPVKAIYLFGGIPKIFEDHKGISTEFNLNEPDSLTNWGYKKLFVIFITKFKTDSAFGIAHKGGFYSIFFGDSHIDCTWAHETGHLLNLPHTFASPTNIPKFRTQNIMDYWPGDPTIDPSKNFYYYQWRMSD